jgi:ubiquinone/menaquinone biosynthesis C-methylase UbiE
VGDKGEVIGLDMTEEMIALARKNAIKFGFSNVRFVLGEIEKMPIDSNSVDAVLSNCVLNLVPDKAKAFSEMFRVVRPGGRFSVSDIVLNGELPDGIKNGLMMYVGCIAGAMRKEDYISAIKDSGFINVSVKKQTAVNLPDEMLLQFITADELKEYRKIGNLVESVTVYGEKE